MKHQRLTNTQSAKLAGYTDVWRVVQADLTETTNNTPQAITLLALKLGDIVLQPDFFIEVVTNGATLATYTVSLGVTGALTQIIGNSNVLAAGAEYFAPANSVAPYVVAADINLVANFIPGAAEALASGTALDLLIWGRIMRLKERSTGIQF
jgi:hypothetical protein